MHIPDIDVIVVDPFSMLQFQENHPAPGKRSLKQGIAASKRIPSVARHDVCYALTPRLHALTTFVGGALHGPLRTDI